MARISGIDLQDKWRVDFALTRIKGLGWALSNKVLDELKIDKSKRVAALSADEIAQITSIGDNTSCMTLKGASERHLGQEPRADEWPIRDELVSLASRWGLGSKWAW